MNKKHDLYFQNLDILKEYIKKSKYYNNYKYKDDLVLYFLNNYYLSCYSFIEEYPKRLFNADFQVIKNKLPGLEIINNIDDSLTAKVNESWQIKDNLDKDLKKFIDNLLKQIDGMSVFGLVNRMHEDKAWQSAYKNNQYINQKEIIEEYQLLSN